MDDLLEGVITNKHLPKEQTKQAGPVDRLVQEAYDTAMADVKPDMTKKACELKKPMSQEDQWAALMREPDPLAETDIYATEFKEDTGGPRMQQTGSSEDTEMDDDIGDLLTRSFNSEKGKSSLVQNIPTIIQRKKDDNYAKLFQGISVNDINGMQ